MRTKPLTGLAHQLLKEKLIPGGIAVDATMGNGHDTLFLALSLGTDGQVFSFDIQEQALLSTERRLKECDVCAKVTLFNESHEKVKQFLPVATKGRVSAATFNLGYLPGSNKQVITMRDSTIAALEALIPFLAADGRITIMAYPGHQGGEEETDAVIAWSNALPVSDFDTSIHRSQSPTGPILLVIDKLANKAT